MWDIWDFIVSGQVPGTTIQITFELWLYAVGIFLLSFAIIVLIRKRLLQKRVQTILSIYASDSLRSDTQLVSAPFASTSTQGDV